MKIISWNCNMAFRKKYHKLLDSNPDIIVIQESENKEKLLQFLDGVDYKQILWFGDNPHKGVAIIGFNNYQIQLHDKYNPEYNYVIPLTLQADKELIHLLQSGRCHIQQINQNHMLDKCGMPFFITNKN